MCIMTSYPSCDRNKCKFLLLLCIDLGFFFLQDNDIEKLVEELCHKLKTLEQHDGKLSNEIATTTVNRK